MKAFIGGTIYSNTDDIVRFEPGIGGAFDLIEISDKSENPLKIFLTRKQVKILLDNMLQCTPLLMVAERIIRQEAPDATNT